MQVDLLLTRECPEFIPEAECFARAVDKQTYQFIIEEDSTRKVPINWRMPEAEGSYWLTARLTGEAGRPVLSQRFVRAIASNAAPEILKQREFILLGANSSAKTFFESRGLRVVSAMGRLAPGKQVVVIWDAARLTAREKEQTKAVEEFLGAGGAMVVLQARSWEWQELCDLKISSNPRFSRLFPYTDVDSSLLQGIDPQWFIRWNGLPGTVARGVLSGPAMAGAEKILWAKEPKTTVTALVPPSSGKGRILFTQLELRDRVDPSESNYDPAAEQILLRFLAMP